MKNADTSLAFLTYILKNFMPSQDNIFNTEDEGLISNLYSSKIAEKEVIEYKDFINPNNPGVSQESRKKIIELYKQIYAESGNKKEDIEQLANRFLLVLASFAVSFDKDKSLGNEQKDQCEQVLAREINNLLTEKMIPSTENTPEKLLSLRSILQQDKELQTTENPEDRTKWQMELTLKEIELDEQERNVSSVDG